MAALLACATAVILLVVADLVARTVIENRISSALSKSLGYDVDVRPGGSLSLIAVARKHLDTVDVNSDNARIGSLENVTMHIRLNDVRFGGGTTTIGGVRAEIDVPARAIAQQVGQGKVQVAGVRTDPGSGTVTLQMGPGGVAEVGLRPEIDTGRLTFALDGVDIFGRPAPDQYRQAIEDRLSNGPRQKEYPLGMSLNSVQVTDSGIRVTLRGSHPTELKRS
ncbi:DUF2993 domain-containing protein [Streptomyces sp. GMY02]|uniref:LmeA family phospholipid-binding protein n=1 Tax=Streptomyces sp. GMY02 TaxID=1333528 RepID=UPI001C2B9F92|nr:DUF2993 domain-containing protein [Streptomyces sp. GMY02]QXE32977.1 DUF2993 domain-containing protein [Streptomyces sp. GMY02]